MVCVFGVESNIQKNPDVPAVPSHIGSRQCKVWCKNTVSVRVTRYFHSIGGGADSSFSKEIAENNKNYVKLL